MIKITLASVLSMGLGFLDFGCSNYHRIVVQNSLDTTCTIELKMKEKYSTKSFTEKFGFDSPNSAPLIFVEGSADSTAGEGSWPLIKKEKVSFNEETQLIVVKLDPKKQLVVDSRKYSTVEPGIYSIRVSSRNQELFLKGQMVMQTILDHDDAYDNYVIECR